MKISTLKEFREAIKVHQYILNEGGLVVHYHFEGKEMHLLADPEQAARLLRDVNFLDDYNGSGDLVTVEYTLHYPVAKENGEIAEESRLIQEEWETFCYNIDFDEDMALHVAALVEHEKAVERWAEKGNIKQAIDKITAV